MNFKKVIPGILASTMLTAALSSPARADYKPTRLYGDTRYETALRVNKEMENSSNIILTSGENFADALTGGVFANSIDGSLILTSSKDLSDSSLKEIEAINPEKIYLVGGENSISASIEKDLEKKYQVIRLAGNDRYQTSVEVSKKNPSGSTEFIITSGENYPDAMVVSSLTSSPLLLVGEDGNEEVMAYLKDSIGNFKSFKVVGGESSVSQKIVDEISQITQIKDYERISGSTRYETSIKASSMKEDYQGLVVVSGENYADALVAGPYAYEKNYALVFNGKDSPSQATEDFLKELGRNKLTVIGGPNSLADQTIESLNESLNSVLTHVGSYKIGGETAAEIVSYNSSNESIYAINGEAVSLNTLPFNIKDNKFADVEIGNLDLASILKEEGIDFKIGDVTSVSSSTDGKLIALALQAEETAEAGLVIILDQDNKFVNYFETGAQPDMVTFSPDGQSILSANEGEPREGYSSKYIDPKGSISIYNIGSKQVQTLDFTDFDEKREELIKAGVLLKPDSLVSDDLEPEYIAISQDSKSAYVSLQENNAIATIDLENMQITSVKGLGFKDHGIQGNEIDIVNDGKIEIVKQPGYLGIYNPDAIATYTLGGEEYIVTANEGDAREWGEEDTDDFYTNVEEKEVVGTGEAVEVFKNDAFEGLDPNKTYLEGARSFSIFKAEDMSLVYDSASDFERITAEKLPLYFNSNNDKVKLDNRSDNKGPEPEGVALMTLEGKTYAFIGLERIGGIMMYDITNPNNPEFIEYINSRDFSEDVKGDSGPEGLDVIYPNENPYKKAYLLVSYEVSGSLGGYEINLNKLK